MLMLDVHTPLTFLLNISAATMASVIYYVELGMFIDKSYLSGFLSIMILNFLLVPLVLYPKISSSKTSYFQG